MPSVHGAADEKLLGAAGARLLCETTQLAAPEAAELAGRLLAGLVAYLDGGAADGGDGDEGGEEPGEEEFGGYSAAYARLHNAQRPERDPLPGVPDGRTALAAELGKLAAAQPGRVPQLVAAACSPEQQQKLAQWCQAAGVRIQ